MNLKTRAIVVVVLIIALGVFLILTRTRGPGTSLQAAFDAEFLTRPDGYTGLAKVYDFKFPSEPLQMDPGLMYRAVADGAVDVIDAFATDGRIPAYDLTVLEDDKGFFPPYYAAPLVRAETLEKYPGLKEILVRLGGRISDKKMQQLNFEVDEKGRDAGVVAREFLVSQGLLGEDSQPGDGSSGTVKIGGKHFTEQEILGQMIAYMIECSSNIKVERKLNLGGTIICFNGLKAVDLDIYAEYTGTGLVNILKREVIADPDKAYKKVQEEFARQFNLIWLEPFGFNNTYTLTMRGDHAEELGIKSISDLARHIRSNH